MTYADLSLLLDKTKKNDAFYWPRTGSLYRAIVTLTIRCCHYRSQLHSVQIIMRLCVFSAVVGITLTTVCSAQHLLNGGDSVFRATGDVGSATNQIVCATDANVSMSLNVKSKLKCANTCQLRSPCTSFNFKQQKTSELSRCQLYDSPPANFSVISGCTNYQVFTDRHQIVGHLHTMQSDTYQK